MNKHAQPLHTTDPNTAVAVAVAPAKPMGDWAKRMHGLTILLMGLGVIAATAVGFAQSWAGLYGWGVEHGLTEWKAISFPAMVDTFIGIGELGLFALALEGHQLRQSLGVADLLLPLSLATGGWAASLAFNVGHVAQVWTTQVTAGVPPIASMLGLFVMLRTLHRVVTRGQAADPTTAAGVVEGVAAPVASEPDDQLAAAVDEAFLDQRGENVAAMLARVAGLRETVAEVVVNVDTDDLEDGAEVAESDHENDHTEVGVAAGQPPVVDLVTAIKAASAAGQSQRQIARSFNVHRSRVKRILDGEVDPGPELTSATHAGH